MCNKFQELDNKKLSELKTNQQDLEWYIRYKLGQRSFCDVNDLQYYLLHRNIIKNKWLNINNSGWLNDEHINKICFRTCFTYQRRIVGISLTNIF